MSETIGGRELKNRWRLILGRFAQDSLYSEGDSFTYQQMDDLLSFLYDREYSEERGMRFGAGQEESQLTVPSWITGIRELFPKEIIERLENDALERYQLTEILTDKKILESMQPNMNLLKNILSLKDHMSGEVLETAKVIVRKVAEELQKELEQEIKRSFFGSRNKMDSTPIKTAKNLDLKKTIRKNLKHYDYENETLILERLYFNTRIKRYNPWHIIICIDESGSMLESVIYAAIMAGIFAKLPALKTSLLIFDTRVVDLSNDTDDPVRTLMSVQLGGGTNIGNALEYCENLVTTAAQTMVVLVSDLCDGYGYNPMYAATKRIVESGSRMFVLTAIDEKANSMYDKDAAKKMAALGAKVAAVTPGLLAGWIAECMS